MKNTIIIFFVFIAILLVCGVSSAKIYQYIDENGVVTFQDYPPENVTPDTKIKVHSTIESSGQHIEVKKNEVKKNEVSNKKKYSNAQVELYVTSWCGYCKKAANFFRSKGVPFTQFDIEKDRAAAQQT